MNVQQLLKSKSGEVVTIDIDETIGDAARRMTAHRIAALVVTYGADAVGVVSEQDIVAALAEHGALAGSRPLSQIVRTSIDSISPDASLKQAMSMMTHARLRHIPVISNERLVGIVSLGDIVKHRLEELALERNVLRDIYIAAH